jgi:hypothetical protein
MKTSVLLTAALLSGLTAMTTPAGAVIYCDYIGIPSGCVARPGVVLRAAPGVGAPGVGVAPGVGAGAAGVGVRPGTPANRGGPVNRAGRR